MAESGEAAAMMVWFDKIFRRMTAWQVHAFCWAFIFFLGLLDYRTGVEASFSVFYLLPISVVAWYVKNPSCYAYSVLAAIVWDASNVLAGEVLSMPIFYVWNGTVRLAFFLTVSSLLQQLRALLDRERELSRRDYRTGLLNTRAFREALEAEHSRSTRKERPLGLAFIDLDNFKKVNDEMGHAEGDRVLVEVARTLEKHLRRSDIIARMGGDEFAVILPECSLVDAGQVAEKLVSCLRELSARESWPVTASVGVVVNETPAAQDNLTALVRSSDHLMYRVKEQGRNSFVVEPYSTAIHA
jgi:diguanylate cyclase (GGDEF)-like protein